MAPSGFDAGLGLLPVPRMIAACWAPGSPTPDNNGRLAGFTSLLGPAAGLVIVMFLLLMNLDQESFVATSAFCFFVLRIYPDKPTDEGVAPHKAGYPDKFIVK